MLRRAATTLLASAWLLVGVLGLYRYGHDYAIYRGFAPPHDPTGVAKGRLVRVQFHSTALGSVQKYLIYLPPGYAAAAARGARFGVLYVLHGSPGGPRLTITAGALGVRLDSLVARHLVRPFLVVMPDGRDGSFLSDTEWADTPHGRYASFVLDLVRAVDARWPTIANRGHRVLAGYSEGAYGAANITLQNLGTFGAFESWSGYFRQTRAGVFAHAPAATLRANSPVEVVAGLRGAIARRPLAAYLYSGAQDRHVGLDASFAAALRAAGVSVVARTPPGRHDWALWRHEMSASLRWAAAHLGASADP